MLVEYFSVMILKYYYVNNELCLSKPVSYGIQYELGNCLHNNFVTEIKKKPMQVIEYKGYSSSWINNWSDLFLCFHIYIQDIPQPQFPIKTFVFWR